LNIPEIQKKKKREEVIRTPREEHPRDIKATKSREKLREEKQQLRRVKSSVDTEDKILNKITPIETKPKQKLERQKKPKEKEKGGSLPSRNKKSQKKDIPEFETPDSIPDITIRNYSKKPPDEIEKQLAEYMTEHNKQSDTTSEQTMNLNQLN